MCGIIGVANTIKASSYVIAGLEKLNHRGTDSAGAASFDGRRIYLRAQAGKVSDVFSGFNPETLTGTFIKPDGSTGVYRLPGNMCIGHTRYPTSGSDPITDAQPIRSSKFGIAIAHNGQINDVDGNISAMLEANALYPRSECDVEFLLHSLKDSLWKEKTKGDLSNDNIKNAVKNTMISIRASAYSAIAIVQDKMIAFRDPFGIKPFVYGTQK